MRKCLIILFILVFCLAGVASAERQKTSVSIDVTFGDQVFTNVFDVSWNTEEIYRPYGYGLVNGNDRYIVIRDSMEEVGSNVVKVLKAPFTFHILDYSLVGAHPTVEIITTNTDEVYHGFIHGPFEATSLQYAAAGGVLDKKDMNPIGVFVVPKNTRYREYCYPDENAEIDGAMEPGYDVYYEYVEKYGNWYKTAQGYWYSSPAIYQLSESQRESLFGKNNPILYRYGDMDDLIGKVQEKLECTVTNQLDDETFYAIRSFQSKKGLIASGALDRATMNYLLGGIDDSSNDKPVNTANSYGRVTKNNALLHSAASMNSVTKVSLNKGDLVRIISTKSTSGEKWYYVSLIKGGYTYNGYLYSDALEAISEAEYNQSGGDSSGNYDDVETLGMIRVVNDGTALHYYPSIDAGTADVTDKGDVFCYIDTVVGWYQIKAGYWIKSSNVKVLTDKEVEDYYTSDEMPGIAYQLHSTGSVVLFIQTALHELEYYTGELSGYFGPKTETAVKAFQKNYELSIDGIVGPNTLARISKAYYEKAVAGTRGTYHPTIYNINWPIHYNTTFKKLGFVRGCETATLTDIATGLTFKIYVQSTNQYHADVEPLTATDTAIMCSAYGVTTSADISWNRRPMVLSVGGYQFVCSIYGEEHGQDDKPNNNYNGQFCVHFLGSIIHSGDSGSVSSNQNHQMVIAEAVNTLENMQAIDKNGNMVRISVSTDASSIK